MITLNTDKLPEIVEMPVELWINGEKSITFMCSPYDLEDLAIGHMITRGLVKDISCIENIFVKLSSYQIFVTTNTEISKELYNVPTFVLSGTSSVSGFTDDIYKIPKVKSNFSVDIKKVMEVAHKLVDEAVIYNSTGGVHGSIIYTDKKYYLREDIGRHCSVDKAIGAALKDGVNLSNCFICTTGRISLDMLLKAAVVGIPLVSSFKYPSDMGVKLANHYDVAIVSKALLNEPLIYASTKRVIDNRKCNVS